MNIGIIDGEKVFIDIVSSNNSILSGVIEVEKNIEISSEVIAKRYLENILTEATYYTKVENSQATERVDSNLPVTHLGNKNGIKYLCVSFHETRTHPSASTSFFRDYNRNLRRYMGYRVPLYIPLILSALWIATYKPAPDEVCFAHVGCFSLEAPWTERPLIFNFVPQSPPAINTTFTLFSRENSDGFQFPAKIKDLDVSNFLWDKGLVIIVHGFTDDATTWILDLKSVFLQSEDVNVLTVDWSTGADMYYPQVVANTRVVAAEITLFLEYLKTTKGEKLGNIHIVGHSLGSHIAGYVGKRFPGIFKITALDPAAPLFDGLHRDTRLDKLDASEVEVIHSNVAPLGLGLREPTGTTDIYLNDGQDQRGCKPMLDVLLSPTTVETITEMRDQIACSHRRAYEVFKEALESNYPLKGYPCPSWEAFQSEACISHCEKVGYCHALSSSENSNDPNEDRIYYMHTNEKAPFCATFAKLEGHICEHQVTLKNVQLYFKLTESERNNAVFEGTLTKLQPIRKWLEIECQKLQLSSLQLHVHFTTTDIFQAPICLSDLSVTLYNETSTELIKYSVKYTEVNSTGCSVLDLSR